MECRCGRPVVSYLDMAFCASCGGALNEGQQFETIFSGQHAAACCGCGSMVRLSDSARKLHIQTHHDQRLWMESLMIRLGELHGFLLQDQTDKAVEKCQQMLATFPGKTGNV